MTPYAIAVHRFIILDEKNDCVPRRKNEIREGTMSSQMLIGLATIATWTVGRTIFARLAGPLSEASIIWVAMAAALLSVTGLCYADGQTAGRPFKVLLSNFAGNQFVGSVVWHADNVALPGQQPTFAVRADIEIPDAGMTVRLDLRRNEDESFVELVFTLPPDLPNGEIANVLGVLMKPSETARGDALNGFSVKVATNSFLIGLSSIGDESRHNVRLIKERPWLDVPIAYSTGKRANIAVEKPALGDRVFAVLEAEAGELQQGLPGFHVSRTLPVPAPPSMPPPADEVPQVHVEHSVTMIGVKPWPVFTAERLAKWPPRLRRVRPRLPRQPSWVWVWPPLEEWSWVPGSPAALWVWPQGSPSIDQMVGVSMTIIPSMASVEAPLWPHVRPPDFRIPMGRSHFAGEKNLEPPVQFVRWLNRIETVLPADEVNRRCRAAVGNLLPPGKVFRGCAHTVAGRCFIIRVDDPGIARHELAHCNGWQHPLRDSAVASVPWTDLDDRCGIASWVGARGLPREHRKTAEPASTRLRIHLKLRS